MTHRRSSGLAAAAALFACGPPQGDKPREATVEEMRLAVEGEPAGPVVALRGDLAQFVGEWGAALSSPGGPLRFGLVIEADGDGLAAFMMNGREAIPFSAVRVKGNAITFASEGYDSEITAKLKGDAMMGEWRKTVSDGKSTMRFSGVRGAQLRFMPADELPAEGAPASLKGAWAMTFTEDDGTTFPGRAEWGRHDKGVLHATILTDTGDYRYLEGRYDAGHLRLSVFDGAHAFLFKGSWSDGALRGNFWSRDNYHATFVATPLGSGESDGLPDPFEVVTMTSKDKRFRFSFPNVNGKVLDDADPRFDGKVLIVDLFGTWCPNCNDQAPVLADWYRKWRASGLEIVGLAFEMTGTPIRDREMVKRYAKRHALEFPLLVAGTSDKIEASELLPDLSAVASFPTTLFIGSDKTVRAIYSGFSGPATGQHHTRMLAESEKLILELLAERNAKDPKAEAAKGAK